LNEGGLKVVPAGQVALVTGAGSGIGRAIAVKLAELGARVVLCGRSRGRLAETAHAIVDGTRTNAADGESTLAVECDVTDLRSVESLAVRLQETFGRLDILVNSAGVGGASGPLHQLAPDVWEQILNTNLRGVYYCIRSLVPIMMAGKGGHIINISSLAGKNGLPNGAAYAASKWGLNGLSYSIADELRERGIRVSVVCPGSTNTEFSPHPGKSPERMLQAADVAHAVGMIVTQAPQSFVSEILLRPTRRP
jgi:NAD(P)-dependent dehydrogenase (short-subunit alcohol dehydrogenase family)